MSLSGTAIMERPSKRHRTQCNRTTTPTSQPRRPRKDLSALLTLPLDVGLEVGFDTVFKYKLTSCFVEKILGHLTPQDLLNLLLTDKFFRDKLSLPSATTVWKAARERAGVPDPPSSKSEITWALLLFRFKCHVSSIQIFLSNLSTVGNTPQGCGRRNVRAINFSLLLRLCNACKNSEYEIPPAFGWSQVTYRLPASYTNFS